MKIALVTFNADPSHGGAERYTVELARALVGRGHEVTILHHVPKPDGDDGGVRFTQLGRTKGSRASRYIGFLDALDGYLANCKFDVVHAMLPVRKCDIYQPHAGLAAKALTGSNKQRKGLSKLLSLIGNKLNRKRQIYAKTELDLITSNSPPKVICLSEAMKADVLSIFRIAPDRAVVIPNGINLDLYDRMRIPAAGSEMRKILGFEPEQKVALFVGQDFKRKGLAEAIKAISELRDLRLKLVIVGGDDPKPFQRLANGLGILKELVFVGAAKDTYPYYAAANFLVFPSLSEPFGLVPAEAIAMCVPTIVSRQAGISELLADGVDALIVNDPKDTSQVVSAIRSIIDPDTNRQLSQNCLQRRESLSYERHLTSMLREYA